MPPPVVPVQLERGPGARLRVSGPGRGGEHERHVHVGAAGHGRVQPLPVLGAGDQHDPGVHGGALGGVPRDRVGQVSRLVAVVPERLRGEAPLASRPVGVELAADHDAARGDGLDPQDVSVGQGPAGFAGLKAVVVAAADDQVPYRRPDAIGDPDRLGVADQAEEDQVTADPLGQFPAAGPVRGHQQHVPAIQAAGHVGAGGLVHGLVGWGATDAAVAVVVIQRGGVALAQPQRGAAFPSGGEPNRLGKLDVAEPIRQQAHGAAAFDRCELLLVPGEHELAAVPGRIGDDGRQMGDGDHGALVGQDQRARRNPALSQVGEQPGGVRGDLDPGRAQFVGGVLGGGGAEHRPVPGTGGGSQDPGFPVPAGPVTISAVRAEVRTCQTAAAWSSRSPRGAARSRASCERPRSCASSTAASAPNWRAAISPGRRGALCDWACATSCSSRTSCAAVAYRAAPGRVYTLRPSS
jgi:hypothetical protein